MLKNFAFSFLFLVAASVASATHPLNPSRYVDVDGIKVAVYESQGVLKPGILLVHGNTSSANAFAKIMRSPFAKLFRVVAVDLPGFGKSDNAPAYNIALFKRAITKVARVTKTDRGILVGWSLGGDLALQASTNLPDMKGYFLIGTAPVGNTPNLPPPFLTPEESYAGPAVQFGFVGSLPGPYIDAYVTAFFRPGYTNISPVLYQDGRRTDPKTRDAVLAAISGFDPSFRDEVELLKNLKVPVALVVGKQDAFVRIRYLKALAPQVPKLWKDRVWVVPDTGHAVQYERPSLTLGLLSAFILDL